ncbi:hypothetical protein BS78_01G130900 [Paspalum vaginatum]|nr:hypothetical protein BS78_01G130900 [Paspalum vaginatum]
MAVADPLPQPFAVQLRAPPLPVRRRSEVTPSPSSSVSLGPSSHRPQTRAAAPARDVLSSTCFRCLDNERNEEAWRCNPRRWIQMRGLLYITPFPTSRRHSEALTKTPSLSRSPRSPSRLRQATANPDEPADPAALPGPSRRRRVFLPSGGNPLRPGGALHRRSEARFSRGASRPSSRCWLLRLMFSY